MITVGGLVIEGGWARFEVFKNSTFTDPCRQDLCVRCGRPGGASLPVALATAERWDFLQESIERRNREGLWRCTLFLVMPDHAHGLFAFDGGKGMVSAIANWKRWTARKEGIDWQKGFFDHRLRTPASVMEKRGYILMNPVRAGLVEKSSDWPYVFDVCG